MKSNGGESLFETLGDADGFSQRPGAVPGTETRSKSSSVMKKILRQTCVIAAASLLFSVPLRADNPPPGLVNFGKFTKPTNGELVEINLNGDTIAMAAQVGGKSQPDLAEVL